MSNRDKTFIAIPFLVMFLLLFQGVALSQSIPFKTIDKGDISHYRYSDSNFLGADMVIRDWKTWKWFWVKHSQGIIPAPPVPKIDFLNEMVLVVMLGFQSSGGGPSIEVKSVEELWIPNNVALTPKGIKAIIEDNREPGPLDIITNPYHIVKVKKYVSVIFEHQPVAGCMENEDCSLNEFCLFPESKCAGSGVCTLKPEICLLIYFPVCGCDMKTYGSQCEAYANGVSIAHTGECR
jgi:hypothetical protein